MDGLIFPEGLTDVKPIREIIYEHVRQAILDGLIKPGQRLVERDIAAKFNASRTPVREALRKLETEGFIEYLPRKGVIVRGFNIEEIEEIYNIRKSLECLAIRSAIHKITSEQISDLQAIVEQLEQVENGSAVQTTYTGLHEFDDVLVNTANMPLLKNFLYILKESLQRYRKINLSSLPRRQSAVREHKEILQAVIDRDVERAEKLVCQHIDHSRNELMKKVVLSEEFSSSLE